jgi:hypothetical protein
MLDKLFIFLDTDIFRTCSFCVQSTVFPVHNSWRLFKFTPQEEIVKKITKKISKTFIKQKLLNNHQEEIKSQTWLLIYLWFQDDNSMDDISDPMSLEKYFMNSPYKL